MVLTTKSGNMGTDEHPAQMADDRRGLLTDREREILLNGGEEVSQRYYATVVSRARNKIEKVQDDLPALEEHATLADELREIVCEDEA